MVVRRKCTQMTRLQKYFLNESTECNLCKGEKKNSEHFLLWCPAYSTERLRYLRLQQSYKKEIIGDLSFENKKIKERKRIHCGICGRREKQK